MTVNNVVENLQLTVLAGKSGLNNQVTGGYTSDLLSDVMGNITDKFIWITLQTHKNVMAIASLREVSAVIIVQGLLPDNDTVEKANEEGIPILSTKLSAFDISGKLFNLLNI